MERVLRDLTDQIYKYNDILQKKALSEKDIIEEEDNLKDALESMKRLSEKLHELKNKPVGNFNNDKKDILDMHFLLDNLSWYFQNIHDRLRGIMKNYPWQD